MNRLFNEHNVRTVSELSGAWKFKTDVNDEGQTQGWQFGLSDAITVIVPSVWNNELGLLNYNGASWYEKKFTTSGGTLRFEFESVMTTADIWLDGEKIGHHYGAFSQFELIVPNVSCGDHTLTVRADSRQDKQSIPQKKVDWFNYGGIARDVYLDVLKGICILKNHIKYTLSSDLKSVRVCTELELYNAENVKTSSPVSVKVGDYVIYNDNVTLDAQEKRTILSSEAEINNIDLWSMENPNLYTVAAKTETDDLIDRVGFRKIEVNSGKILLNGKQIKLRGVNRHEEHPDWGFAFPAKLMKKDLDLIVELGCNTVRGSHYPQSRVLMDMLDERGILFWSEIPIWGGGFPDDVLQDPVVVERGLNMHKEMAHYYYNHPSIIIWGIHNELYTVYPCTYGISKLYSEYLRENGGNRLITHASLVPFEDDSMDFDDIICINMYKGWYSGDLGEWNKLVNDFDKHRKEKGYEGKPVIISEFGAGALAGFHSHFDRLRWSEEYQSELLKYCLELFHKTDYIHGFYIWQFCNIRTWPELDLNRVRCFNNKGILDEYRNPKVAYFTVRELYRKFASEERE